MRAIAESSIRASRVTIFVIVALVIGGTASFYSMPSQEDPEITIRNAQVSASFPGMSPERVWCGALGEVMLKPWGLFKLDPGPHDPIYYSLDEDWVRETITAHNPRLTPDRFYLYGHKSRPYLCVGSVIFPRAKRDAATMLQMESTPFGAGIPGSFPGAGPDGRDIGGGQIQPFGIESTVHLPDGENRQRIDVPYSPFDLADVIGASGAGFAGDAVRYVPALDDILPGFKLWPVMNANDPRNTEHEYIFGDGGLLENTSITPLLRRQLQSILCFVNGPDPLSIDTTTGELVVDGSIPPLFGIQPHKAGHVYTPYKTPEGVPLPPLEEKFESYRNVQVFPQGKFRELVEGFRRAYLAGGTIMYQQELDVLDSPFFAIRPYKTTVLWFQLSPVPEYERRLRKIVRWMTRLFSRDYGDFPNYATFGQFHLSERQINLLANHTAWNVTSDSTAGHPGQTNADIVRSMFQPARKT